MADFGGIKSEQVQKCGVTAVDKDSSTANDTKRQKVQLLPVQQSETGVTEKKVKNQLLKLCKHLNNFFFKGFLQGNFVPFTCEASTVSRSIFYQFRPNNLQG